MYYETAVFIAEVNIVLGEQTKGLKREITEEILFLLVYQPVGIGCCQT